MVAPELEIVCSGSGLGFGSGRLKRAMTEEVGEEERLCMDKIKERRCSSTKEEDDELTSLPDNAGNSEHQLVDNNKEADEAERGGEKENGYKNENEKQNEEEAKRRNKEEQHWQQNHQDDDGNSSLRKQHVEGNKEACKLSYSKQFNRLDPNRRSFSTPAVNSPLPAVNTIHQTGTKQSIAAATTTTTTTTSCNSSNTTKTSSVKAANKSPSQVEKRTTLIPSKLRRRTALGLISFGSSNYKVAVAHQNQQNQQQQVPVSSTSGQKSSASNWRSWFSSSSSSSSSSKNEQTQAKSSSSSSSPFSFSSSSFSPTSSPPYSSPSSMAPEAATTTTTTATTSTASSGKRLLLRNLRPQTLVSQAITTSSTIVVGNKSKQEGKCYAESHFQQPFFLTIHDPSLFVPLVALWLLLLILFSLVCSVLFEFLLDNSNSNNKNNNNNPDDNNGFSGFRLARNCHLNLKLAIYLSIYLPI